MTRKVFRKIILPFLFLNFSLPLAAQESEEIENEKSRLPVFSVAPGVFHFLGDIGISGPDEPMPGKSGFQMELQHQTKSRISFAVFLLSGKVSGEEQDRNRSLNFRSSIVSQGILFRYDFISKKMAQQILIPYLTAGIEYVHFKSYADLKDENGITYQYWNDGTVRNISQSDSSAQDAVRLYRDYTYETDLRDANLDGFGKYNQSVLAFPLGGGVRFCISPKVSIHLSTVVHFLNSDMIDGVSEKSLGSRKGDAKNDKFVFSSAAFRYDFAAERSTEKKKRKHGSKEFKDVDFDALVYEDSDGDGIPDIHDDSSATPGRPQVDSRGKPIDADNDGIPDYRDLEPNSAPNAVVTVDGVTITEEMIEEKFRRDSLEAIPALIEYIQSYDRLTERNPDFEKSEIEKLNVLRPPGNKIPLIYRVLDSDGNDYISPKEISLAIDEYIAGKSQYSIPEFYNLIDFFFQQK